VTVTRACLHTLQKYKAVIIEGRVHHAFDFVCRKALLHLGPDWSLHVFHSKMNDEYVHQVGGKSLVLRAQVCSIPRRLGVVCAVRCVER